jgi:hypothetical protein
MAVLADAAPCGPVPSRTCKRQWTVRLPAVQQAAAAVSPCPCRSRAGVHRAGRLRAAGVRRLRLRSQVWTADVCRLRRPGPQPRASAGPDTAAVSAGRPGVRPGAGRTAALRRGHGRGAPEQGRDMAIAGGRPSMHVPPAAAVEANRRMRCPREAAQTSTRAAVQTRVSAARRAAAGGGHCGSVRRCVRNCGRPAMPSGRLVSTADTAAACGVCGYRKRSPDRWPLVWCRHCR